MDTTVVQPKSFSRDAAKQHVEVKIAKDNETMYPFQWLLFRPQAHAIQPFETNSSSRDMNTKRSSQSAAPFGTN